MTTQLGLDGMPTRLFACTPSRLTTWLDCPRRYRMTYLDRPTPPRGPASAHTTVGAAVHLALARWWDLPRRTPETARALVDTAWPGSPREAGFRDEAQSERWRHLAGDMVQRYAAGLDPDDQPVGIERTVATRTDRLALSGRVDRIDARGDEVVVVDYKTGRWVPTEDDARGSLALAVYAVAAGRTLRRPCTSVELHHLPSGRVVRWTHSEESLARHVGRAEAIATEAQAATAALAEAPVTAAEAERLFPARPGPACGWCDLAQHCPEGTAAAPRRAPWDGLAEDREPPVQR